MRRIKIHTKIKDLPKYSIIDDEDYIKVSQYNWHFAGGYLKRDYYVATNDINGSTVYLHRFIMNAPKGTYTDHVNGNKLDNRKSNLRLVDQTHNNANFRKSRGGVSKYKGVTWCKFTHRWRCRVKLYGKEVYSKRFDSEIEAAKAYNKMAKEIFGEFAYLNKIKNV